MKNQTKFFTIIFSALILFSCKDKGDYSKIKNTPSVAKITTHKIVIDGFLNTKSYTYLNVDENEKKYWMAIPNKTVKVGETYYYNGGMVMTNFESKQLKRKFDKIIFVESVRTTKIQKIDIKQTNPHVNSGIIMVDKVKIDKPKNGISLEDLFKNEESYSKKSIIVRGKVVKVNNSIMDRNWVHIIDGTKFGNKNSLTISTKELVKVGDTVTFKGNVTLNKDFGNRYVYPLLVEDGKLIK